MLNTVFDINSSNTIRFENGFQIEFGRFANRSSGDIITLNDEFVSNSIPCIILTRDHGNNFTNEVTLYYHWIDNKSFYLFTGGSTYTTGIFGNYIAFGEWK